MRSIRDMDAIQIEITNHCQNRCSNCTRLIGHHSKPYMMDFDTFKIAVDSLEGFPKQVGMMGGEPLLHPEFEKMARYLGSKRKPEQCGLWSSFPKGFEKYAPLIAEVFGNVYLNDHSRKDVLHAPILVRSDEVIQDEVERWYLADHCWYQNSWSASINPQGAFFCEIAAAISLLSCDGTKAWPVEPGWWRRSPIHFGEQMLEFCHQCGGALPLQWRYSIEGIDDISPTWLKKLKDTSPKIKSGKYLLSDLVMRHETRQCASYKDSQYREQIANRYGLTLMQNDRGFMTPLKKLKLIV